VDDIPIALDRAGSAEVKRNSRAERGGALYRRAQVVSQLNYGEAIGGPSAGSEIESGSDVGISVESLCNSLGIGKYADAVIGAPAKRERNVF